MAVFDLCDTKLSSLHFFTFCNDTPVVSCLGHDVQRHEANYHADDYCDYVDYYRFGRVEKQLASKEKFPTHRQKRTWRWVFYLGPLQIAPAERVDPGPAGVHRRRSGRDEFTISHGE
jgi:hypothetical protein